MATSRLALLCLSFVFLVTCVTSQRHCTIPNWDSDLGEDPIASNRGKVVLIALMKGYCSYCWRQAAGLAALKNHLANHGVPDISMTIINGGEEISRSNIQNLIDASPLPVLQDTEDEIMFRQIFRGEKDDFIVFDRCGHRVAFIPHQYSNLEYTITERVLRAVYRGAGGCACSLNQPQRNPHDVMYGDQPSGPSYASSGLLDLQCPRGDIWCRRYLREYFRNRSSSNRMSNRPRFRQHDRGVEQVQGEGRHRTRGHGHTSNRGRHGRRRGQWIHRHRMVDLVGSM